MEAFEDFVFRILHNLFGIALVAGTCYGFYLVYEYYEYYIQWKSGETPGTADKIFGDTSDKDKEKLQSMGMTVDQVGAVFDWVYQSMGAISIGKDKIEVTKDNVQQAFREIISEGKLKVETGNNKLLDAVAAVVVRNHFRGRSSKNR